MLCITMKRGEYFTVDGDTVILFDQFSGERAHLTIHAPRNIAIVRGAVLERNGNPPPACLAELSARKKAKYRPEAVFRWNDGREQAVRRMEQVAERLEKNGSMEEAKILRDQLEKIVPAVWEDDLSIQRIRFHLTDGSAEIQVPAPPAGSPAGTGKRCEHSAGKGIPAHRTANPQIY